MASRTIRVALCQVNPVVGDLVGNSRLILDAYRRAEAAGAQLAVFGELVLCGHPPGDLLLKKGFVADLQAALADLAKFLTGRCAVILGTVRTVPTERGRLFNSAVVISNGEITAEHHKAPTGADDCAVNRRYFDDPGAFGAALVDLAGTRVAIAIGDELLDGPQRADHLRSSGVDLVVNLNASPFRVGIQQDRVRRMTRVADTVAAPVVAVNLVGAQDGVVFDGGSCVVSPGGVVSPESPRFAESVQIVDLSSAGLSATDPKGTVPTGTVPTGTVPTGTVEAGLEEVWSALALGLADYVRKNGFDAVALGLSGGIDSALVAAVAVDALGAELVHGVLMPSRYSSPGSVIDAEALATALGMETRTIPIEAAHGSFESMFEESFEGLDADLTEENLQARIRGVILMSLSNKFGWLILTTGNKSETAVGYSTLYGDSAGGLSVIADVPKTMVYELATWRNARAERLGVPAPIPGNIITKAPSAELRPGQRDDQSLPPYGVLDPLLAAYIDDNLTAAELIEQGWERDLVHRVTAMVDRSEYKRRQGAPVIVVSTSAFGVHRRMPITNRY